MIIIIYYISISYSHRKFDSTVQCSAVQCGAVWSVRQTAILIDGSLNQHSHFPYCMLYCSILLIFYRNTAFSVDLYYVMYDILFSIISIDTIQYRVALQSRVDWTGLDWTALHCTVLSNIHAVIPLSISSHLICQ
jgi:hypothetical protein